METSIDRELLKQQRKERKKLKKLALKEEKLKTQNIKSSIDQNQQNCVQILNEKGKGLNRHVKSNKAIQASLESLQKTNKSQKKVECKRVEASVYLGNPLDSSHPQRFKGKHREEPEVKKLSKLKSDILKFEEINQNDEFNTQQLCNNLITDELNHSVEIYIKKVVQLQDNAYFKDPGKMKFKKRYVCGFHELKKKLIVGKIKFFIIATNVRGYDPLCKIIQEILTLAESKSCSYAFALKRSKLGNLCKINRPVSCLGVLNHQGAEEEFKSVVKEIYKISDEDNEICENDQINKEILEKFKEVLINSD